MTKTAKIAGILMMTFLNFNIFAQQEAQNSFYMFNPSIINPAYAGSRDALSVVLDSRVQWTGWKGAPKTNSFIMHTPLVNESIGLGINVLSDVIGPTNRTSLFADFAYRLKLNSKNDRLCFGIRAGTDLIRNNFSGLYVNDPNEPGVADGTNFNTNTFNTGAAVYYYGKRFFVGFTAPKTIPNKLTKDARFTGSKEVLHYYLIAGYVFKLNSLWDLKPGCAIKYTANSPLSIDANLSALFINKLWLGLMYRHGSAAGANIVYNFTKQLRVGYAYDYSTNRMGRYNPSTHEVVIGYDFLSNNKAYKSPRYF
jgi:type IX secretion system PorP/SprF family membrane protein